MSAYKRKHTRAPLISNFLYEDDGYIYKAKSVNISEEGILIDCLPHLPRVNIIPVMLDIPRILHWENFSLDELKEYSADQLEREIFRARVKTLRRNGETSDVDQIFIKNIGGQIVNVPDSLRSAIAKYVFTFAKNTVFLLKLLENSNVGKERIEQIRLVSHLMGYDFNLKISVLKEQVSHHYKSLIRA